MDTIATAFDWATSHWDQIALVLTTIGTLIPTDHDGDSVAGRVKNLITAAIGVGGSLFGKKAG